MDWQEVPAIAVSVYTAAFVVVVFAVGLCFWGYRIWGAALCLGGFALGAALATLSLQLEPAQNDGAILVVTVLCGATFAALFAIFNRLGAFVYGAALGSAAVILLMLALFGRNYVSAHAMRTIVVSIIAGLTLGAATLVARKPLAIVLSSLTGAALVLAILFAFEAGSARPNAPLPIPLLVCPALLFAFGTAAQFLVTAKDDPVDEAESVSGAVAASDAEAPRSIPTAAAKLDAATVETLPLDRRLTVLESLKEDGMITDEEFQRHRSRVFASTDTQSDSTVDGPADAQASESAATEAARTQAEKENVEEQLRRLKSWHDDGLIDVEDYQQKRRLLLKKAFPVH